MKDCNFIAEDIVIKCFKKGKMGCYRIAAAETVSIPSNNEIIIPGNISEKGICLKKIGIIEPYEPLMEKESVLGGRVLAKADENVPVRLMNATSKPVVIKKGTIVGTFEPVNEVRENTEQLNKVKIVKESPEALQVLLDKSSKHLDRAQKNKLKSGLTNYQDVFSLNDNDM